MKSHSFIAALLCMAVPVIFPSLLQAQTITTIAGCGLGDDSLATRAELVGPVGVTRDNAGNTYIVDEGSYRVRKVDASGVITTIAGNGVPGNSGDGGPATNAHLGVLYGVTVDKTGNVYVVDNSNNRIRKINTAGIISTIAGTGVVGYTGDGGPAIAAELNSPIDIVADTSGNLYFTDWLNNVVRKIDGAGIITTVVGDGVAGSTGNGGPATASELGRPFRVTMDRNGNLYVASVLFQCICKVDTGGIITIIGGTGAYAIGADGDGGPATDATMTSACGLAVDTFGNIYFSDIGNERIRKIDGTTGIISNYAATGAAGYGGDGAAAVTARISTPEAVACDLAGNLYICDADNNRVRKVSTDGTMSTFAGQNTLFGEGYAATNAELCAPSNIATDAAGNVYVADYQNNRVRKITMSTGIITTVAGSGVAGYLDGYNGDMIPALTANIYFPAAVAVDGAGNIYVCDQGNMRIRKVDASSGNISTIAGDGTAGFVGEGIPAVYSEVNYPAGIAVDGSGNIFIADEENYRIRKIDAAGIITTFAGVLIPGYSGDGGAATMAKLQYPNDVAVDGLGNVYICDGGNSVIRKVDTAGVITTVAGTGVAGFSGDNGPAISAQLAYPSGVKADRNGNIFISDGDNQRVRMVTSGGIITTVAGNGTAGFSGDGGPAVAAMLNFPAGVAVDMSGNLFIADGDNHRIRQVNLSYLSVASVNGADQWNIRVYPNPAKDVLTITNAENSNLVIHDVVGKEVMRAAITTSKQSLNISGLATGIYILQVTNDKGEKKIVKVNKE